MIRTIRMVRMIRPLGVIGAVLFWTSLAQAQIPDHLQCFKIKDAAAKASYLATITPTDLTFPAAAGCEIKVPAKLLCVDAVKSNVTPNPPGSDDGIAGQKYLCYKTKCPKSQPTASLTDQFGVHAVEVKATSLVCAPVPEPVSCTDLTTNGDETDVDCGGSCPDCALGQDCVMDGDCASAFCLGGVCSTPSATCNDAIENGAETGIDCGGGTCPDCLPGQGCLVAGDCTSNVCSAGTCQTPLCSDGVQNGTETGTDCGGGSCPTCANGQGCSGGSDCTSGTCSGGICVSLLMDGAPCAFDGQCFSSSCVDGVCCNSACGGLCQACTAAKKGSGGNGTCGDIANLTDPDNECLGMTTCDGAGACTP